MPVLGESGGTFPDGPADANDNWGFDWILNTQSDPNIQEVSVGVSPVTFDEPVETTSLIGAGSVDGGTPMGYFMQNEYFLKRIVGNIYVSIDSRVSGAGNGIPSAALVACGFYVARAEDRSINATVPIGFGTGSRELFDYNPLHPACAREPWIWRRTWIISLGNNFSSGGSIINAGGANIAGVTNGGGMYFPPTNVHYGDAEAGTRIDAKTARRVRQDERLYFAFASRAWKLSQAITNGAPLPIVGHTDIRLLGQMRKPHNRGAF